MSRAKYPKVMVRLGTVDSGGYESERFIVTVSDPRMTDDAWSSYDDPSEAIAEAIEAAKRLEVSVRVDTDTLEALNMQTV